MGFPLTRELILAEHARHGSSEAESWGAVVRISWFISLWSGVFALNGALLAGGVAAMWGVGWLFADAIGANNDSSTLLMLTGLAVYSVVLSVCLGGVAAGASNDARTVRSIWITLGVSVWVLCGALIAVGLARVASSELVLQVRQLVTTGDLNGPPEGGLWLVAMGVAVTSVVAAVSLVVAMRRGHRTPYAHLSSEDSTARVQTLPS